MMHRRRRLAAAGLAAACLALVPSSAHAQGIPTPEQHFGFKMGTEGKLPTWGKTKEYFKLIGDRSSKADYFVEGKTTEGDDYPYLVISSAQNMGRLNQILEANNRLAEAKGLTQEAAAELASQTVPVYLIEAMMHSTEIGEHAGDRRHRAPLRDRELALHARGARQRGDRGHPGREPGRLAQGRRLLQPDRQHRRSRARTRTSTTTSRATTTTATGSCSRRPRPSTGSTSRSASTRSSSTSCTSRARPAAGSSCRRGRSRCRRTSTRSRTSPATRSASRSAST